MAIKNTFLCYGNGKRTKNKAYNSRGYYTVDSEVTRGVTFIISADEVVIADNNKAVRIHEKLLNEMIQTYRDYKQISLSGCDLNLIKITGGHNENTNRGL